MRFLISRSSAVRATSSWALRSATRRVSLPTGWVSRSTAPASSSGPESPGGGSRSAASTIDNSSSGSVGLAAKEAPKAYASARACASMPAAARISTRGRGTPSWQRICIANLQPSRSGAAMSTTSRSGRSRRARRNASPASPTCTTECPRLRRLAAMLWRTLDWESKMRTLAIIVVLRRLQALWTQPVERCHLAAEVTDVHPLVLRQEREVFVRVVELLTVRDQRHLALLTAVEQRELGEESRPVYREQRARGTYRDEDAVAATPLRGLCDRGKELPGLLGRLPMEELRPQV